MKVAIYARVSTEGMKLSDGTRLKGQTVDPQLLELREYCTRQGWLVASEWTDVMSGTYGSRPGLDAMFDACRRGGIDAVVVVKLDRLGRSLLNVVKLVEEMDRIGVAIICSSQGIDTRKDSPGGRMMLQVMAAVSEFERALISERTKAGLRVVKARGVVLGRPSKTLVAPEARGPIVAGWLEAGRPGGLRGLAKLLGGCSPATAMLVARDAAA